MFPEFGQTPKSLELDLDSYEESWTHIAAFRGQSGWLRIARATIQSAHDLLRADLIVACDDHETPIPAWRAVHLTQCRWDRLDHCYEEPPEILDDLLCEEEGAFYARWQREMNTGLAALYDRAQRNIEALEARSAARIRALDRQIADLRRRRRMVDASDDARAMFTDIIAELEAEHDGAIARLARQRSALRREADAAEEALWQRTDVLIEVEPLCLVRWRAKSHHAAAHLLAPELPGSGGISLHRVHRSELRALALRRAEEAREEARRAEAARAEALAKQAAAAKAEKPPRQSAPVAEPQPVSRNDLPKASPILRKLAAAKLPPTPIAEKPAPLPTPVPAPPPCDTAQPYGKLDIERDVLAGMLEGLEEKGRKFLSGSPKYRRNLEERADLARQIAALDAQIAARDGAALSENPSNWTPDEIATLRKAWASGYSAREIAEMLGRFNRNAVIGKAKRLGLPMRAQTEMPARQSTENELPAES